MFPTEGSTAAYTLARAAVAPEMAACAAHRLHCVATQSTRAVVRQRACPSLGKAGAPSSVVAVYTARAAYHRNQPPQYLQAHTSHTLERTLRRPRPCGHWRQKSPLAAHPASAIHWRTDGRC